MAPDQMTDRDARLHRSIAVDQLGGQARLPIRRFWALEIVLANPEIVRYARSRQGGRRRAAGTVKLRARRLPRSGHSE